MKNNLVKAVASVATATTLLFATATCFAATANTVTTYGNDGVKVTSTISGVTEGQMVTYLAGAGDGAIDAKEDIIYITQWTSDGTDKVVSYNLKETPAVKDLAATVKYGSDVAETAEALNADAYRAVEIEGVTVKCDTSLVTVSVNDKVGSGDQVTATWEIDANYEVDKVLVNSVEVEATNSVVVPYAADGAELEIIVKAKEGTPTISTVDADLKVEVKDGDKVLPSVGMIAQVTGKAKEYGIYVTDAEGNPFVFEGIEGYFAAAGAENADEGYYAVNIAGADLEGSFIVKSYVKIGDKYYYGADRTVAAE